ncbi:hypothetical protein LZ30DRAFT_460221 [Colletotrichum cereale]|nr:hypothetical protein LZ30DRAFT_460221 [Colletotrichum cereale]
MYATPSSISAEPERHKGGGAGGANIRPERLSLRGQKVRPPSGPIQIQAGLALFYPPSSLSDLEIQLRFPVSSRCFCAARVARKRFVTYLPTLPPDERSPPPPERLTRKKKLCRHTETFRRPLGEGGGGEARSPISPSCLAPSIGSSGGC